METVDGTEGQVGLGQQPLEEVTEEDLQALLREQVPEGKEIDYKETVHADHGAVREFLADLTSFANTAGGHLLVGMKATNGVPTELIGVSGMPADALISRLESAARDAIEPRLPGVLMHSVRLHSGTEAIVIRIPRSYALPHVVKHQGHWRFYGRNSNGKYQLDVAEVGALFARSQGLAERVRDFRVERLAAIVGGQAALLLEDGPKLVLHVIPLNALDGRLDVGIPLFVQEEDAAAANRRPRLAGRLHLRRLADDRGGANGRTGLFLCAAVPQRHHRSGVKRRAPLACQSCLDSEHGL